MRTTSSPALPGEQLPAWRGVVIPYFGAQSVIYLINVLAGWLLVRQLPPPELAVFTAGFAAFTILNVIANGGVASVMTSQGALVIHDPRELRGLIDEIQRWRVRLALLASLVALPLLIYSMRRLGHASLSTAVGFALAVGYVGLNIAEQPWTVVLRLQGHYKRLQLLELTNAIVRLSAVALLLTVWPSGLVGLAISVAAEALLLLQVRRAASAYVSHDPGTREFGAPVARVVKDAVPGVAFYALQGHIGVWIMMLFGSHFAVASIGALGRVSAIYAVLGPFMDNVIGPRYARLETARLPIMYRQLLLTAIVLSVSLTLLLITVADVLLSVLGPAYRDLKLELSLVLATAAISFVATVVGTLNKARSWVAKSWILAPATILTQFLAISMLPITTLRGALLLGLVSVVPGLVLGLYQASHGLRVAARSLSPSDAMQ